MPQVSIIIPVFNVAPYITKCLQSVASQTYKKAIECLIIDDCGQDDSISLAESFINNYNKDRHDNNIKFRILHHKYNRGLSAARNTGIKYAQGEWLYFLDSDDWIIPECIELMMKDLETNYNIDIVIGQYNHNSNKAFPQLKLSKGIYEKNINELYAQEKIYMMAWNKLYRLSFLNKHNIRFIDGLIHEDIPWSFKCFCYTQKIMVLNEVTYWYNVRDNSIQTHTSKINHFNNYWIAYMQMINDCFEAKLQNNYYVFAYINKRLISKYNELNSVETKNVHKWAYYKLRSNKYWSLWQIYRMTRSKLMIIIGLHRYMPIRIGFAYFEYMFSKLIKI